MLTVNKIDESHVSIKLDGLEYVISRKEAIELASEIIAAFVNVTITPTPRQRKQRCGNARTRFEIYTTKQALCLKIEQKLHAMGIRNAEWFSLSGIGSSYVAFVTSSQRVLDKVNKALGTKFTFDFLNNGNVYYL